MFPIIGILVVLGCIAGGYLMEKGNFMVLMQPAELLIILGAALGTVLIGNPVYILKSIVAGMIQVLKGSRYTAAIYLDTLKFLTTFSAPRGKTASRRSSRIWTSRRKARCSSGIRISQPTRRRMHFFCDTMRTLVAGGVEVHDLDQIMETDLEVLHRQALLPAAALSTMADSLPGLGIVAAVLGVVITMSALGGPPEEIGHKVAAALVGTFLGILLCYGFLGPIAANIKKITNAESEYFLALRMGLLAFMKGVSPILALEAARRAIPHHVRPTFQEMDKACRKAPAGAPASEAAA